MSKILITGGNSFIAKSIIPYLTKCNHYIFAPNKTQVNLLNNLDLFDTFNADKYDFVIHCAGKGGRRYNKDSEIDFLSNIDMLLNLLHYQRKHKFKLIVFSSGAELDLRNNLFDVHEDYFNSIPIDYYGKFKYLQTKLVENYLYTYNLRLFNVFGELGMKDSFIWSCINKCINNEDFEIWNNIYFDVFYSRDLALLIDFLIKKRDNNFVKLNCVYNEKYTLLDLANKIKNITNSKSNLIIKNDNKFKNYCSNGNRLNSLGIKFDGIDNGLVDTINSI